VSRSIIISFLLFIILSVWMLSSILFPSSDKLSKNTTSEQNLSQIKIEVEESIQQKIIETKTIQGSLEPFKTIYIRAEIEGIVKEINFQKGQAIKEGELLFRIDERDLPQKLAAAKAALEFQRANLKASKTLLEEGFETPIEYSRKQSAYKIALSDYENILKDIEHTKILAPTTGIINSKNVEIGDYVEKNALLADIVELEQLKVFAFVPQQIVGNLKLNTITNVILENEEIAKGEIIFISAVADSSTRTFKIEIKIDNPDGIFQAGRSVTLKLPLQEIYAHLISPALLLISENGGLAIKYIDDKDIVQKADIKIIKATDNGLWVSGLPPKALIIVQGAGFVSEGEHILPKNIIPDEPIQND